MGEIKKLLGSTDVSMGVGAKAGGASDLSVPAGSGDKASKGTAYEGTPFAQDVDKSTPLTAPSLSSVRLSGSVIARNLLTFGEQGMLDLGINAGYRFGTNASALDLSVEPAARYRVASSSYGPVNAKLSIFAGAQNVSGKDFSGWLGQIGGGIGGEILLNNKAPLGVQLGIQKNFGGNLGNGVSGVEGNAAFVSFDLGALIFDSGKPSWKTPDADAGDPTACEREAAKLAPTTKALNDAINKCKPGDAGCSPEPVVVAAGHNADAGNPQETDKFLNPLLALAAGLGHPKYAASAHEAALPLMDKLSDNWERMAKVDGTDAYNAMIEDIAPRVMPLARIDLGVAKKLEGLYGKAVATADKLSPKDKIIARIAVLAKFYASTLHRAVSPAVQAEYRAKADAIVQESVALLKANPEYAADALMQLAEANKAVKGRKASRRKPAIAENLGSTLLAAHKKDLLATAKLIKSARVRNKVTRALIQSMKAPASRRR